MAPKYVAPSFSGYASNSRYSGGGGGGGGGFDRVIQLGGGGGGGGDPLAAIGLQGRINSDLQMQQTLGQNLLAEQAKNNELWLFQQKVSEQEQLEYRRNENAIAAIMADPSYSQVEKQQIVTDIRTRQANIGTRMERDLKKAQAEAATQHANLWKQQGELEEWKTKFATQEINGKLRTMVDDDAVIEIGEELDILFPDLRQTDPVRFQKELEKEAIRQKRATRYTVNEKGIVDLSKGVRVGMEGAAGTGARSSTGSQASQTSESGTEPTLRTEESMHKTWLSTKESIEKRLDTLNKEAREAGRPEPFTGGEDGKEGSFQTAVRNAMQQAGFSENWADHIAKVKGTDKKAAAIKQHQESLTGIDNSFAALEVNQNVPPAVKAQGGKILSELKAMIKRFPPGSNPTAQERIGEKLKEWKKFQELMAAYDKAATQKPAPAKAGAAQPQGHWTDRTLSQRMVEASQGLQGGFDLPGAIEDFAGRLGEAPDFKRGRQRLGNFLFGGYAGR